PSCPVVFDGRDDFVDGQRSGTDLRERDGFHAPDSTNGPRFRALPEPAAQSCRSVLAPFAEVVGGDGGADRGDRAGGSCCGDGDLLAAEVASDECGGAGPGDRKSTRLNSSHVK